MEGAKPLQENELLHDFHEADRSVNSDKVSNIPTPQRDESSVHTDLPGKIDDSTSLENVGPAAEPDAVIALDLEASIDSVESPIAIPKADKKKKGKDPSSWSDEKLLKKLKKIAEIKKDRSGSIYSILVDGKTLLDDTRKWLLEALRRFNELQHFAMTDSYVDDDLFHVIIDTLRMNHNLETLSFKSNMLTNVSIEKLIAYFSGPESAGTNLRVLDVRNNNLLLVDGLELYRAFAQTLKELNGFQLNYIRTHKDNHCLDMTEQCVRAAEVAILCALLAEDEFQHITELNLSKNSIDAKSCEYLLIKLIDRKQINTIDISHNPITNDDKTFVCLELLSEILRVHSHLKHVTLMGITVPSALDRRITTSLQVNRQLFKPQPDTSFEEYVAKRLVERAPVLPKDPMANWRPKLTKDFAFCKKYNVPHRTVEIQGEDIELGLKPIAKFY